MKDLEQFIGLYPVSKTLRFQLLPIGKTQEWIDKNEVLTKDGRKAEDYPKVKKLIDDYHKQFIEQALSNASFDWIPLRDAILKYRKDNEEKKALEKTQEDMRKAILKVISACKGYKELTSSTPKDLFEQLFPDYYGNKEELESFTGFATYFRGFQENRNNIYSSDAISTSVPYRIVHDNFPKFLSNLDVYKKINDDFPSVLNDAKIELCDLLDGRTLEEVFSINFFNQVMKQSGIDFYNQIIGGISDAKGQRKIRGINEFVNLYCQQNPDKKRKGYIMIPLYKQILSDRESFSFIPQEFKDEQELKRTIEAFYQGLRSASIGGTRTDTLEEIGKLLYSICEYDPKGLFITKASLNEVSHQLFKDWELITKRLGELAEKLYGSSGTAKAKKNIESYMKKESYSLEEINEAGCNIEGLWGKENISLAIKNITDHHSLFKSNVLEVDDNLFGNAKKVEIVKDFLDSLMELLHKAEVLVVPENNNLDVTFYNQFLPLMDQLKLVIPLYTKARNFLTRKPGDVKKFKLNFEAPTLANGWDKNKEKDNCTLLFKDNGGYYLAVLHTKNKHDISNGYLSEGSFQKMIYHQISDPTKDLPNLMVINGKTQRKTGRVDKLTNTNLILEELKNQYLPDNINNIRKEKSYLKSSPNFKVEDSREYIKYYMQRLVEYKAEDMSFSFKPINEYGSYSDFLDDVAKQRYSIEFAPFSKKMLMQMVDDGIVYLFQIYNKDYAPGSHGNKNLHTLFWENLFSEENLQDIVLKLNGEAELFYRRGSIQSPVVHKTGDKILNKRDVSGMPIPESSYMNLHRYFNGKLSLSELSDEDKQYLGKVVVKDVTHDIIKDRRFTKPSFMFHVPITINYKAQQTNLTNDKVREYIKANPDVNIIGIDRGERHLIYLTLINQGGKILKQKTFNIVNEMNYQAKLTQREKERDNARKSWKSIGKIKELKEGFLSAVVHEITQMMVDYNAIVVLEDLNFGFKRGRFKVERQVYQKFEKMLIDKLNYLPFKQSAVNEPGGVLRGYQLTQKFESFKKLGRQSGFLFYIPAAYTSKIDPVSGFVNLFDLNEITNAEKKKEFFLKFKRITYVSPKEGYEFDFNYDDFKTAQTDYKKAWTITTYGKRIVMKNVDNHKQMADFDPTEAITKALTEKGLAVKPGADILKFLQSQGTSLTDAPFWSDLFYAFSKTLQMRNSNSMTEEDYILSPVSVDGKHYCSKDEANKGKDGDNWVSSLPVDADANGAYHIALKGLYAINHLEKENNKIEHSSWFEYMQTKPYLKK